MHTENLSFDEALEIRALFKNKTQEQRDFEFLFGCELDSLEKLTVEEIIQLEREYSL